MAEVALTSIKYGYEEDGENKVVNVEAGKEIPSDLPQEVKDELRESGAIGEIQGPVDDEEKAALRKQIVDLQAQLDKANPRVEPDSPGVAAEKLLGGGELIQDPDSGELLNEDTDDEDDDDDEDLIPSPTV